MKFKNLLAGLFLGITMAAGVAAGVSVQANVAKEVKADTVTLYFYCPDDVVDYYDATRTTTWDGSWSATNYGLPYAYCWNSADESDKNAKFPGEGMTAVSGVQHLYSLDIKSTYTNVIFVQYGTNDGTNFSVWNRNTWDGATTLTLPADYSTQNMFVISKFNCPNGTDSGSWDFYSGNFEIEKYKILGNAEPVYIETDEIPVGSSYAVPKPPLVSNYQFLNWYTDEECTQAYTTAEVLTEDIKLYAKYRSAYWENTLSFDLRDTGWSDAAAKYAVYFYDEETFTTTAKGWSSLISAVQNQRYLEFTTTLDFAPDRIILVRFNTIVDKTTWEALDPYSDDRWNNKWNQSVDEDFATLGGINTLMKSTWEEGGETKESYWFVANDFPVLKGSKDSGETWDSTIGAFYDDKVNESLHVEFYGVVNLKSTYRFKVVIGDNEWYGTYETHESLKDAFSYDGSGNISCNVDGDYKLYFDTVTKKLYITTEALAAADEWGQLFLGVTAGTDNCTFTKNNWSASETAFWAISDVATRNLIKNATHYGPHEDTPTYLAKAIQRYDYVLQLYGVWSETNPHGFGDFLGRVAAGKISLSHPISILGGFDNNNTTPIIVIVIVSLVAVTTIGGYFYLRKRKQD